MGLRSRIITVVVVACSIISLFLCFYITEQVRKLELASLRTKIDKAAYVMRLVNTRPLYNVDLETLKVNMETFFDDENMKSISIEESDIDINIHLEREFAPGGMDIHKSFFIYYNGLKLGKINVVYSTSLIEKKLAGFRTKMIWFTFSVIVVMTIILIFLINALMRPVTKLAEVASEIAAGNLEKEIEGSGVGEVGILSRNFATMRDAIKDKIEDLALTNKNLEEEIQEKVLKEKKILHQSRVISSVNTFFQKSMLAESYKDVADLFIPIAQAVVTSHYCFVAEVDEEGHDQLDMLAVSEQTQEDCGLSGIRLPVKCVRGIKEKILLGREPLIANNPMAHPDFISIPENHVHIDAFMGLPMIAASKVIGMVGFAGNGNGFTSEDLDAAQMLVMALVEALSLRKKEEEKNRLEEMIVQSEKMVSLGGLAAGMAHEINNPLAGILQNTQVIRNRIEKPLPANLKSAEALEIDFQAMRTYMEQRDIFKMLDAIMAAGKRAADIVANMLSFSRKSASGFIPEDVSLLLDQTLELAASDYNLKKKFDFKQIRIERDYDPDLPLVECKSSEIQQVFFNIFSNGAQAMVGEETPLVPPCFLLKTYREENFACIEIEDNGPGMSRDVRKRIFEPFYTTKEVGEGTGLGLAVSYFIVTENHKGRINVESAPGKGARFRVRLPLKLLG